MGKRLPEIEKEKRDMAKNFRDIIKESEPTGCYQLKVSELLELAQQDDLQAILDAFEYGFAQGVRCERNRQKREARQRRA